MKKKDIVDQLADVVTDPHELPHPVLHLPPVKKAHPEKCAPKCVPGHCVHAVPRCLTLHVRRKLARKIDATMAAQEKDRRKVAATWPEPRKPEEVIEEEAERTFERIVGFDKR